jgi:hypothetical protein
MSEIGDAIQEMREGGKVRRRGWKGKWLELDGGIVKLVSEEGDPVAWLILKDDSVADDLLADDWEGVD